MANNNESPLKKVCIICAKGTIEDVYATLVMANGAVMEGIEAKIFFRKIILTRFVGDIINNLFVRRSLLNY